MIICVYKPIRIDGVIDNYEIVEKESLFKKGTYFYRVVYKCDGEKCKSPDKIYSINRDKLSEKRSSTVNENIQICRSCQTTGKNNPRFGDNRKWCEVYGEEKSEIMKRDMSDRVKGDGNPSKNPNTIKNKINNNLYKYGVENVFQLDHIKEKSKKTLIDKYGVEYPMMCEEIKEKSRKTNYERYGVEHPMMLDLIKKKAFDNSVKKYGEYHSKVESIKNKNRETSMSKYGVDNFVKSEEYRKNFIIFNDVKYVKYIGLGVSIFLCEKGHHFEIKCDNYHSRLSIGTPMCTICNPIGDSKSIKQKEVFSFIQEFYSGKILDCYRDKMEIDIYLPDKKIGIEFNGLYWHSVKYRDKGYHLEKTNYFKQKGIRIIHIWEDDWIYKKNIIKSQIRNILSSENNRIYARKCEIVELDRVSDFLNDNHIQGRDYSIVKIGLLFEGELVSVMTFNKSEGRKKMKDSEWNLSRFCNKINTNVIGGASRMLKYFIENNQVRRIISYADKDWSIGDLYIGLGFEHIYDTKPDYKYIIKGIRRHKQNFKKNILGVGEDITESKHMSSKGVEKIYDCGKMKFEKYI
jgi:hypothetical protein